MYNISIEDSELANSIQKNKTELSESFLNIIKRVEGTLDLFSEPIKLIDKHNLEKNRVFWNTARYINIISLDLKILPKHQSFSELEWEKRLFARQIALLIYESIDDILSLLGKEFKIIVNDYKDDSSFSELLNHIRKKINQFKEIHFERIQAIRNNSIAHREKNTSEQLNHIYKISWIQSVNITSEFDSILNELGQFLEIIMRGGISDGGINFHAY
jgi:hypothetical protein